MSPNYRPTGPVPVRERIIYNLFDIADRRDHTGYIASNASSWSAYLEYFPAWGWRDRLSMLWFTVVETNLCTAKIRQCRECKAKLDPVD